MRKRKLGGQPCETAVIIGGMEGVVDTLRRLARQPQPIPLPAPGGVLRDLFDRVSGLPGKMRHRIDFTYLLYRLLDIDPSEPRVGRFGPIDLKTR